MAREKPLKNAARSVDRTSDRIYELTHTPPEDAAKWAHRFIKALIAEAKADAEADPTDEPIDVVEVVLKIAGVLLR